MRTEGNDKEGAPSMQTPIRAAKVTCEVYRSVSAQAEAALRALQADHVLVHGRRMVVLHERAPLPFLPPTTRLEEDPAEAFEFYLPLQQVRGALLGLARELRLFGGGRGAIFAEEVALWCPAGFDPCNARLAIGEAEPRPGERLSSLSLLNCVVQRGQGNDIARRALEAGSSVPSIGFGIGTGVRNRLGLLRVAIPAEKEIVSLLVDAQDTDESLQALVEAGRLDQPGRGFVGAYPALIGVANPKSFRGPQRHGATMEQVISAIDDLTLGAEWRRRSVGAAGEPRAGRRWLKDLVNFTVNCNEGRSDALVAAAIAAGAGGATISKAKLFSPGGAQVAVSPAREVIDLGIAAGAVDGLLQALGEAGAGDREWGCFVETKALPTAFTYVAP